MTRWLLQRVRDATAPLIGAIAVWSAHEGFALGASIAFYSIFALAPLLVISIAVAGLAFGAEAVRGRVVEQFSGLLGTEAAEALQNMIIAAWRPEQGLLASAFGLVTLMIASTGVLVELKRALNALLDIPSTDRSFLTGLVRARLMAFAIVLAFGFLLIVSLVLSTAIAALGAYLPTRYPEFKVALAFVELTFSLAVLTAAYAVLIRWLPDEPPATRVVWISAVTSAVLFSIGKYLVGIYLARAGLVTAYGAAGSLVVLIMWVYFSAQVLLLGVSFGRQFERKPVDDDASAGQAGPMADDEAVIDQQRAGST